jgi:hypothetical protein
MSTETPVESILLDIATTESKPKLEGKQAFLLLAPDPVKVKEYLKTHAKPEAPTEPLEDEDGADAAAGED